MKFNNNKRISFANWSSFGKKAHYNVDEFGWDVTQPEEYFTVFDYSDGTNLEKKNNKGVTVKSRWSDAKNYKVKSWNMSEVGTWSYPKSCTLTVTITYPKNYKNAVVAIGALNTPPLSNGWNDIDAGWASKKIKTKSYNSTSSVRKYGSSLLYKSGKGINYYIGKDFKLRAIKTGSNVSYCRLK